MKISKKKFNCIAVTIIILIIEALVTSFAFNMENVEQALILVSSVSAVFFLIEVYMWKQLTKELLSPFLVFFIVLFVFCCGQSVGWIFGIEMGKRDLWNRVSYGIDHLLLCKGMCYSMIGISGFYLGALLGTKLDCEQIRYSSFSSDKVIQAYKSLGKLLVLIAIPAFFAITVQNISAVASNGYLAFYSVSSSRSTIMKIVNLLSDFYQPCMLLLFIAYRDNNLYRKLIIVGMMVDAIASLYVGARSGAFMIVLGIIVAYHYFIKPFSKKQVLIGLLLGYLGMALSNVISATRVYSGRTIADTVLSIFSADNVISEFFGELGWNLTSICWTMELVPSRYPFRYGLSYLVSLLSFLPSSIFAGVHPIVTWANLGDWLQEAIGLTSGPGYTMVAESYINFGWYGWIALIIEGILVAKVIARVSHKNVDADLVGSTFQVLIIMTIMKSLTRASFSASVRTIIFVLIPLYIFIRVSLKKGERSVS